MQNEEKRRHAERACYSSRKVFDNISPMTTARGTGAPLRFGIIGCGGIAGLHVECLKKLEQEGLARLTCGCDPNPSQRQKFTERWGLPAVASLEELLARA